MAPVPLGHWESDWPAAHHTTSRSVIITLYFIYARAGWETVRVPWRHRDGFLCRAQPMTTTRIGFGRWPGPAAANHRLHVGGAGRALAPVDAIFDRGASLGQLLLAHSVN